VKEKLFWKILAKIKTVMFVTLVRVLVKNVSQNLHKGAIQTLSDTPGGSPKCLVISDFIAFGRKISKIMRL